jgi:hypothetical protein
VFLPFIKSDSHVLFCGLFDRVINFVDLCIPDNTVYRNKMTLQQAFDGLDTIYILLDRPARSSRGLTLLHVIS